MFKLTKDLKTTDGSKKGQVTGIPKLVDANEVVGANLETAPKFWQKEIQLRVLQ